MTVILDTNALMMPVECNIRLFEQLATLVDVETPLVPHAVRDELRSLADGQGTEATAASVGLDLLDRCELRETESTYADDAVLELALTVDAPVVTNDRDLRARLHGAGVSVICLRGKNKLELTQP